MSTHCEHLNPDGTFKNGFDGCVLHMMSECGGGHSEDSAKKICGKIAAEKAAAKHASAGANLDAAPDSLPLLPRGGEGRGEEANDVNGPLQARMTVPLGDRTAAGPVKREIMVLPAGQQTGCFSQGGVPVTRSVLVDPSAADSLQRQLEIVSARSAHKPYFDFNHGDDRASGYPLRFFWKDAPRPGVYAETEWTASGAGAIAGRDYQAFSPVFYTDRANPARVICRPHAGLNFGGLVNDPALKAISPLTAKKAPAVAAADSQPHNPGLTAELKGTSTMSIENPAPADSLQAKDQQITALRARLDAADQALRAARARDAQVAVQSAIQRGALPPRDEPLHAKWQRWCEDSPEMVEALNAIPGLPLLSTGSVTTTTSAGAPARFAATPSLAAKEGPRRILQAYGALVAKNAAIHPDAAGFAQKGQLAREMAALYSSEIRPRFRDFADMPLAGADFTDPAGNLGTLSGTLVAQRTLELFKLQFPAINRVYTDFSDSPAQFKQTEATRVVVVPSIVSYSTTPDGVTGRPQGWVITVPPQTLDVLITLDEHIGVPIVFDSNMLASTARRLFDEQAPAASYAFAKYFVEKIYKLMTPANFNAYAAKNGAFVPTPYATFAKGQGDFARSSLVQIAAIFNPNQVPIDNRTCLLNSPYYGQLAQDPSLVTFYSGQRAPEIITDNELPKLGTFVPVEAPNLTNTNPTPNLVGFAMHKAGIIAKCRLSNDYTMALPGSSYGSVTTITDPDIGISVVLVQYVNHTGGYAEWRIQAMLGAAVGDKRGGLCITSQ